jgi:hypothetical protein
MLPDKYWSEFFGLTIKQFRKPGLQVVVHKELAGWSVARILIGQTNNNQLIILRLIVFVGELLNL